jgi:peptide/nickel transport system substrate-binding protein
MLSDVPNAMDPSREYGSVAWSLLRDMTRTLLQYRSVPGQPGDIPQPDLAAGLPMVSDNSTVWTFAIKPGVRFGPPINRAVTCQDFQTAFRRELTRSVVAAYSFYYSVIKGADDVAAGRAGDISGITCPQPDQIRFELSRPTGDFDFLMTLPATAPTPAEAVRGHDQDYGRFLVSTGCYMWHGEDQVDFGLPVGKQRPASGYQPGRFMVLVRNPAWAGTTDDLRACYLDRIEITIGGSTHDVFDHVRLGDTDLVLDQPSTPLELETFQRDPRLARQISPQFYDDATEAIWMNLTVPPFDDLHVRKAVEWIVDRAALTRFHGGPSSGEVATHIVPPSMAGSLPTSYDPYPSAKHHGDLARAQQEMRLSRYDPNHRGMCDAPACKGVLAVVGNNPPEPDVLASVANDLSKIGITLNGHAVARSAYASIVTTPARHVGLGDMGWGKDYADAVTFMAPLFDGRRIRAEGNTDVSLVDDPTVNADIDACTSLTGSARQSCWAALDRYLMENVVPWVPYQWSKVRYLYSNRVAAFAWDQFTGSAALDGIALTRAAIGGG